MGFFSFKNKIDSSDRLSCHTCKTNCLGEISQKIYNVGFSEFPIPIQNKMDELREIFVKINDAVKVNNYRLAEKLKQEALETYAQFYGLMQRHDVKLAMIEKFVEVIELMMQRHMEKKAYEFINS